MEHFVEVYQFLSKVVVNLPTCKNWDRQTVHCASVEDIAHITCKYWRKDIEKESQKKFIIKVDEYTVHQSTSVFGGTKMLLGVVQISEFGVNSNIATTGHKL